MFYIDTNIGIIEFYKIVPYMKSYWTDSPIEEIIAAYGSRQQALMSLKRARQIIKYRKHLIAGSEKYFSYIHTMTIKYYDGN